jgi:hypothetical protein
VSEHQQPSFEECLLGKEMTGKIQPKYCKKSKIHLYLEGWKKFTDRNYHFNIFQKKVIKIINK